MSYHNGDHYNSVRRASEPKDARGPANIVIDVSDNSSSTSSLPKTKTSKSSSSISKVNGTNGGAEGEEELSDYENVSEHDAMVQKVMRLTCTSDPSFATTALEENAFCVEAAVDYVLKINSQQLQGK